ncbi:Alpha-beta hydrolase superfamily lysophospholipase [Azospirillaceae bacterium]
MPLMFVHGAFCGAAIWDVHFLPYFATLGYEVHAVSLRGHGGSEGRARLPWFSLNDYVADLVQVIQTCRTLPVLIGHSMGGMVVQRYLRTGRARGSILMASVPPYGLWDSTIGLAFRDPMLVHQLGLLMTFGPGLVNTSAIHRAMFSERVSAEDAAQFEHLLQSESQRVVVDMLAFDPFALRPDPRLPMLVLGGERDAFIPASQVEATARTLGTDATIFPHMAHAMMLEPDWRVEADHIAGWVERVIPE